MYKNAVALLWRAPLVEIDERGGFPGAAGAVPKHKHRLPVCQLVGQLGTLLGDVFVSYLGACAVVVERTENACERPKHVVVIRRICDTWCDCIFCRVVADIQVRALLVKPKVVTSVGGIVAPDPHICYHLAGLVVRIRYYGGQDGLQTLLYDLHLGCVLIDVLHHLHGCQVYGFVVFVSFVGRDVYLFEGLF